MIYLAPEVRSGLGEDTFWTWFNREIPSSFKVPARLNDEDWLLQYATLGKSRVPGGRKLALLWELYPEMKAQGVGGDDARIAAMKECARTCEFRTAPSPQMAEFFEGEVRILPIGVDTDLFKPRDKAGMRKKHGIAEGRIGFWCGTGHPMKGRDRLESYMQHNPGIRWIVINKTDKLPQPVLAEQMCCADFVLFTGRLRPYFMVEWEAMACDIPVVDISGAHRDFVPGAHPRDDVMRRGWSRHDAKKEWQEFLCGG